MPQDGWFIAKGGYARFDPSETLDLRAFPRGHWMTEGGRFGSRCQGQWSIAPVHSAAETRGIQRQPGERFCAGPFPARTIGAFLVWISFQKPE